MSWRRSWLRRWPQSGAWRMACRCWQLAHDSALVLCTGWWLQFFLGRSVPLQRHPHLVWSLDALTELHAMVRMRAYVSVVLRPRCLHDCTSRLSRKVRVCTPVPTVCDGSLGERRCMHGLSLLSFVDRETELR